MKLPRKRISKHIGFTIGGIKLPGLEVFDVHELLPKLDCGLCNNPRCMTFARNILYDIQKPKECPFLREKNLKKINEMMAEPKVVRKHLHPNIDKDTIEITPCTEDGKVTLETQLRSRVMDRDLFSDFFDQFQLCHSLSEVEFFDKMNCSSKMGYALVESGGKRAHVFKTGKIIMRRADNKDDALATFHYISKMLLPARLCSCNNTLADCFGGSCTDCANGTCAALVDAVDVREDYHKEGNTIASVMEEMDLKSYEKLQENFMLLSDFVNEIHRLDNGLKEGQIKENDEIRHNTDKITAKIKRNCMEYVTSGSDASATIIALTQYGLGRDLIRARDGLLSLDGKIDDQLYSQALKLLYDAYIAFEKRDIKESQAIEDRFLKFISNWKKESLPVGLAKIATNGFYISRVLGKPVPQLTTMENEMKI